VSSLSALAIGLEVVLGHVERPTLERPAAVDVQDLACQEPQRIPNQEAGQADEVVRLADPPERRSCRRLEELIRY
jgi:hypothetical protein